MTKPKSMKVFIWEGVFADYTDGMAVVIAKNKRKALAAIKEEIGDSAFEECRTCDPEIIDPNKIKKPKVFFVYGGG